MASTKQRQWNTGREMRESVVECLNIYQEFGCLLQHLFSINQVFGKEKQLYYVLQVDIPSCKDTAIILASSRTVLLSAHYQSRRENKTEKITQITK